MPRSQSRPSFDCLLLMRERWVDVGSMADWASAGASTVAVGVALYIAGWEQRAARRDRERLANEQHERHAQIRAEAIRLAAEIETLARQHTQLANFGVDHTHNLTYFAEGHAAQLDALQRFPMEDPRLFSEIGRIAAVYRRYAATMTGSPSQVGSRMRNLANELAKRREALAALT